MISLVDMAGRRDSQIRALLDRVYLLEQHCLAHAIGLPSQSRNQPVTGAEAHGLLSLAAAVDVEDWQPRPDFSYDPSTPMPEQL